MKTTKRISIITVLIVTALFYTKKSNAQWNTTWSSAGTGSEYNNGAVGIQLPSPGTILTGTSLDLNQSLSVRGTHIIFNSTNGVLDFGGGSGTLFFRSLTSLGGTGTYNSLMSLTYGGNLGIGSGGSNSILGVIAHSDGGTMVMSTPSSSVGGTTGIEFNFQSATGANSGNLVRIMGYTESLGGGDMLFQTAPSNSGAYATKMILLRGGNVGINTTTPGSIFGAVSQADGGTMVMSTPSNNQAGTSGIEFNYQGATGGNTGNVARIMGFTEWGGGGDLLFQTAPTSTGAYASKMVILQGGNVGIGTTTPGYLLDVTGGFLHSTYNTQSYPASSSGGGLAVGWNYSNGNGEVNLYNVYNNAATAFQFSQKTGASTSSNLVTILGNGSVGIGSGATSPSSILSVVSQADATTMTMATPSSSAGATTGLEFNFNGRTGNGSSGNISRIMAYTESGGGGDLFFQTAPSLNGAYVSIMNVYNTGKVVIGNPYGTSPIATASVTTPGSYTLYVAGGILTEQVRVAVVNSTNWADYVFADDYKLKPLNEVEEYFKANKHLPEVPSTAEVKNGGIDVAGMDATLLKKIEELTLYVVELQKQNNELAKNNNNNTVQIQQLQDQLKALCQTK